MGWNGPLAGGRLSITSYVYYTKKNDFVSPLVVETPLLLLNGADIADFLASVVGPARAGELAADIGPITLGGVSSD